MKAVLLFLAIFYLFFLVVFAEDAADVELDTSNFGVPEDCVFPFDWWQYEYVDDHNSDIFLAETFFACAPNRWGPDFKSWCAVDQKYVEGEGIWKYCHGANHYCIFPFIYNGEEVSSCIEATDQAKLRQKKGGGKKMFWCSITDNYDADQRWAECKCEPDATSPADCFY